jgi:phosphomannomutase
MSGHFFFRDRWSGYDDAIYAAARLAELVSASSLDALLGSLPKTCATPELKIDMNGADMPAAAAVEQVASVLAASGEGTPLRTDGIRMEYDNGFGLLRASNTTQSLVLRFEGDTPADLERIRRRFADALQTVGLAVGDGLT